MIRFEHTNPVIFNEHEFIKLTDEKIIRAPRIEGLNEDNAPSESGGWTIKPIGLLSTFRN